MSAPDWLVNADIARRSSRQCRIGFQAVVFSTASEKTKNFSNSGPGGETRAATRGITGIYRGSRTESLPNLQALSISSAAGAFTPAANSWKTATRLVLRSIPQPLQVEDDSSPAGDHPGSAAQSEAAG
jgi:hypothetical protein